MYTSGCYFNFPPPYPCKKRRFHQWVRLFENGIVGPFYFGDHATYVDYYLCSMFEWLVLYQLHDLPKFQKNLVSEVEYPGVYGVLHALAPEVLVLR